MALRLRVEQDARRVHAARADDDDLGERLPLRAGLPIEILHAVRAARSRPSGCAPRPHSIESRAARSAARTAAGDRRNRRTTPCRSRRRNCRSSGTPEIRESAASCWRAGRRRRGCRRLRIALLQQPLAAARRRRRLQELAAGQHLGVVRAAAHADQLLDLVVVRRDVR